MASQPLALVRPQPLVADTLIKFIWGLGGFRWVGQGFVRLWGF